MKEPLTPFPTNAYYGPKYFCDRDTEANTLANYLRAGQSVTLVSVRRLGKTGLIHHVGHMLSDSRKLVYMDILATESMIELQNELITAVVNTIPEETSPGKKVWGYIKSLHPVFSFDTLTGMPKLYLDVKPDQARQHIRSVFQLLEEYPEPVIIAIDEFQQILNYPEKTTDAWLRSIIQTLRNVTFIFSGSAQHLMLELFSNPNRPFYRSASFMKLGKISTEEYAPFIRHHFLSNGKEISEEVVHAILEWTECFTYYVQLLCNNIYISGQTPVTLETWHFEAARLLEEQQPVFLGYREMLTKPQWALLKAIALEGEVYAITSKAFISRHSLGSSATVLRSLEALITKSLVYSEYDGEREKYYKVYDLLFAKWVKQISAF